MQEQIEAQSMQFIKLTFEFKENIICEQQVVPNDILLQLKQLLSESTIMSLYQNFYFEWNGQRLQEYAEISQQEINQDSLIKIQLDSFDERTAKYHLNKVQEILRNPQGCMFVFAKQKQEQENKNQVKDSDEEEESQAQNQKNQNGQNAPKQQQNTKQQQEQQQTEQYSLNDATTASLQNKLIQKFFDEEKKKLNTTECIYFINYSGFNPPPDYRRIRGDLFYLHVKTLENQNFHITVSPQGFYLNKSSLNFFDPEPLNKTQAPFYNLIDLLNNISPLFKENFNKLIAQYSEEKQEQQVLNFFKYGNKWIQTPIENHKWDMTRCENSLLNLYGFDPINIRDWNEELQVCRDLPSQDIVQRLNKNKALIKVYNDFVGAAVEGAKAVIEQNIQPLNPMDPQHQQVYVFNGIFFSLAIENDDNFRQENGSDDSPNVSVANGDLRNLRIVHKLDIPGLNLLNTCLVDYKGKKIIAQSVIPGILNSDHYNCSEYGSIDNGKTICTNKEFETIMKKICEYFNLDDEILFYDENQQQHTLSGSIEIKGIRGSDRRRYILDLLRLSPRDLNYPDSKEHSCCVLRQELIYNYVMAKNFEEASKKLKEKEENKEEEEKKSVQKLIQLQEYLQNPENHIKLKLNTNIGTKAPLVPCEKLVQQEKELQDLSQYLIDKAIPNLIADLINNQENSRITDSKSISECFHLNGVNMRYLGKVINTLRQNEHPNILMILQKTLLVRCLKHVLREIMRNCQNNEISFAIANALNSIFSVSEIREKIEKGEIVHTEQKNNNDNTIQEKNPSKQSKKNKKQQNKQQKIEAQNGTSSIYLPESEVTKLKPSQIWEKVLHIAKKRYSYEGLPENMSNLNLLNLKFNKLSILRDLLRNIGVNILYKEYYFSYQDYLSAKKQTQQVLNSNEFLPFTPDDIQNITPNVKFIDVYSEDVRQTIETAQQYFQEQKLQEALECYHSAISLIYNLYGINHKDICICYNKIGSIYYKLNDFANAIYYQKLSVKLSQKISGFDNHQVSQGYQNIGFYYFAWKKFKLACKYLKKALFIYLLVGGEAHPDTQFCFFNLSLMFQQNQQHQQALNCLLEALERNIIIYGKEHLKVVGCYQAIALIHYDIDDIKQAIDYQQKCIEILKKHLEPEDPRIKDSLLFLYKFESTLAEKKKVTQQTIDNDGNIREFGSNKVIKNKNKDKKEQDSNPQKDKQEQFDEREILKQRLKYAKMNAKLGYNNPNTKFLKQYDQQQYEQYYRSEQEFLKQQELQEQQKQQVQQKEQEQRTNQKN